MNADCNGTFERMDYVIAAAPRPSLPVVGTTARFPIHRIYCVGRNYLAHVREMGFDEKTPPFFFTKANDMLVEDGATIPYPPLTNNFHHEVELVVAIGKTRREYSGCSGRARSRLRLRQWAST